jgi:DnaJ-domain-containing protein 1
LDNFIDRFADFLRSLVGGDGRSPDAEEAPRSRARFVDPDVEDAWQELDDFMKGGTGESRARGERPRTGPQPRPSGPDESLRKDYANLEVPFGSSIDEVRASYKRLILRYHPDRQAGDSERQRVALEITKKINASFERIRAYHDSSGRPR